MKRLVMIIGLVLLFALAACDTMGPTTQEVIPTGEVAVDPTAAPEEGGTTAPTESGEVPEDTTGQPGVDLQGVTWEWVSQLDPMGQTVATDPTRYTIVFNSDGTANIRADCNNVVANYLTDGTNLEIQPGAATLAACPEDSQDQLFMNGLMATESYVVQDGELFLTMGGGSGTLIFRPGTGTGSAEVPEQAAGPSLTGTTWQWVSTTTPVETITSTDPARYTITFNEDGTANVQADCNSVGATYIAGDDSTLTITLGPTTLMACPEDSQADIFNTGLTNAAIYSFDGDDLLIDMPASAGTMRFRAATTAGGETPTGSDLTNTVWEWLSTTTTTEEIVAADPARYRIVFNDDGTAGITADCNVGNAEYTAGEDGSLSITLGVSTLAFCENSQDQIYREGLAAAASYSLEESELVIGLVDGGSMRFRNGGSPQTETPDTAGDSLTGVTWEWVKTTTPVEEVVAVDQTRYNVVFNEDGSANIKADCNTGVATYTADETGAIAITPGAMTLAMCPPDSQATRFMADLSGAAIYFFQDGNLFIDLFASSGTMEFAPAAGQGVTTLPEKGEGAGQTGAPSGLTGTTWQINMIAKTDGNITFNGPDRYTILFNEDGTANIQADCNSVTATYTVGEGNTLKVTPGASTMALCPPGSLDQIFLGGLTNSMGYRLEEGNLLIDMLYESGTMIFSPAP